MKSTTKKRSEKDQQLYDSFFNFFIKNDFRALYPSPGVSSQTDKGISKKN